ncbi:hypothetical protein [Bifidobacterium bifidum]|uniref:hypothetical protein n=1 Tax=Bifidobacterium bifidum TaxID=1681 RepID=UPI000658452E|nr:hypothetical protein [Bifidobacterium bifidum]KAB1938885.1 hypothetical protein F8273_04745 [Bifidobacterium bifidum]KLN87788.1 hypothetical protein LMG11583_0863 [Bifidobacterium bifidum]
MTNGDRNLRLTAFILNIISMVALGWTLLPLAWMIPMTVMSWGIYKGARANTVAFGVCNLLFVNTIGGPAAHQQQRVVTDSAEFQACRVFCPVCTGGRVMYSPVACQGDIADIA